MFAAKMANFKVAEVANHKRKIPPTFDQRVAEKEAKLKDLQAAAESQEELKAKKPNRSKHASNVPNST